VAQVALDYRQWYTALDEPRAMVRLRSWGLGRFVRPFSLAVVKAGNQTLVWKFCARRDRWVLRASPSRSE
jgi:hypothetical protein